MEKFLKYNVEPKFVSRAENKAIVEISNLEKGFGQTLGNSLRRICLSNISGAAMFAISIPGIHHEFGPIENVVEDVTEIILNLKRLVIKFDGDDKDLKELMETSIEKWPTLKIRVNGPCEVTAADIDCPPFFKILNKDLHIATITNKLEFKLDIYAKVGRGFKTCSENKELVPSVNIIPTDSSFSPVLSFNYEVEEVKNSKTSTTDRLILTVVTNGAITAANAIAMSSKILSAFLEPLIVIDEKIREQQIFREQQEAVASISLTPIEELELSVRAYNALKFEQIYTLQDLLQKSKDDISKMKNLGRKSVQEIIDIVHSRGLKLKDEK